MQKKKSIARAEAVIILVMIMALLLPQLIGTTTATTVSSGKGDIRTLADFDGMTFVTQAGLIYEDIITEHFPSSGFTYIPDWSQMPVTVSQGKADAFICEAAVVEQMTEGYDNLAVFPLPLTKMMSSFAGANTERGIEAAELFNDFLAVISADGTFDELTRLWMDTETAPDHIDMPDFGDAPRGKLSMGSALDWSPFTYEVNGEPCGLFVDLSYRFCQWAGYEPEIEYGSFLSALTGLATGKYDFMPYGVTYTEERGEEMYFTDEIVGEDVYVVTRSEKLAFVTSDITIKELQKSTKKMAVIAGTEAVSNFAETFPDAELMEYNTLADVYAAVAGGKADIGMSFVDQLDGICEAFDNLTMLYEPLCELGYSFAMQKTDEGAALRDDFNVFLDELKADGRYDAVLAKWNSGDETLMHNEPVEFSGENGTLRVTTTSTWVPMTYFIGNEISGRFIDLVNLYCADRGYTPEYVVLPFASELTALLSGDVALIADGVGITPERTEQANLTDPMVTSEVKIVVPLSEEGQTGESVPKAKAFISNLKESFEKNFVRENRWQMLLSGLWVTVSLSVFAAVFGTLLGSVICALRMSKNCYFIGFARIFIKIIQGTPIVVLLLVLYYVIFGKTDASAFWVCVLGFSLDFAAYSAEIIRTGIESVPDGQRLAARALGFSRVKAFQKVVLPQAMVRIVPVFSGQFIAMVKMTSVAGYISVQDLTKASDIIRSRTYEAFFPLISTAIMYFLIAALLVSVLRLAEKKLDPAKRSRKLKGVKVNAD